MTPSNENQTKPNRSSSKLKYSKDTVNKELIFANQVLIRNYYPEHIKNYYNPIKRQITQLKSWQRIRTKISLEKIEKQPVST